MELTGERLIAAPRTKVWEALNDPEVLKACIPGCQEMEKTSPSTFAATVKQKVGPVNATFKGAIELTDVVEAVSYRISGEGKGGAAGFAKGGAKVDLLDETLADGFEGTKLSYAAEAKVGGKLAQLGSRLIDGFAKKMADQFFDSFKAQLEPKDAPAIDDAPQSASGAAAPAAPSGSAQSSAPAPAPAAAAPAADPAAPEKKGWFGRLLGN